MSLNITASAQAKASLRQGIDLKTELAQVAEVSLTCLAAIRERLLASQDIMLEDDPELKDEDQDDADDCDLGLGDEDALDEEDEVVGISDQETGPSWTRDGGFELRVVSDSQGGWRVNVPLCGWEGLAGKTKLGQSYVDAVSSRQLVYLRLALWLEKKHQDVLARGPFGRVEQPLVTQKGLLKERLDGRVLFDGVTSVAGKKDATAAANLSRYLKNVDLSWPQGSIPLRGLFAD